MKNQIQLRLIQRKIQLIVKKYYQTLNIKIILTGLIKIRTRYDSVIE